MDTAFVLHSISDRKHSKEPHRALDLPSSGKSSHLYSAAQVNEGGRSVCHLAICFAPVGDTLRPWTVSILSPWYVRRDVVYSLKPDGLHMGSGENILQLFAEGVGKITWTDGGAKQQRP